MICPKCGLRIPLDRGPSYFDGHLLQLIGWHILGFFVTFFTLGICYPWAICRIYAWEANHTVINGRRLQFDGTAVQLFGNWIKWWALCIVTLGIYSLWLPIKVKQWVTKHTSVVDIVETPQSAPADEPSMPLPDKQSSQKAEAPRSGNVLLSRTQLPNALNVDEYVVLDTETTGLSPETDKVIEIALIKISGGKIVDEYCTLVNPQQHISSRASKINGIYDDDVKDAPLYDEVGEKVAAFLGNCTVIGHNVKFDFGFMGGLLKNVTLPEDRTWSYIDTVELARRAYSDMKNYKLQTLVQELSIDTEGAHRARADALATWKLFELCKKEISKPDALYDEAVKIVVEAGEASAALLQRQLKIGYSRAARIIDEMEARGIVGPFEGSKPRKILITDKQIETVEV